MRVKNVSARLHHVGGVSIAPGETKEIQDVYAGSINKAELVPDNTLEDAADTDVVEGGVIVKRGRKKKVESDGA